MLSLSKHLYRAARVLTLMTAREMLHVVQHDCLRVVSAKIYL
jgi:hypothetical protein